MTAETRPEIQEKERRFKKRQTFPFLMSEDSLRVIPTQLKPGGTFASLLVSDSVAYLQCSLDPLLSSG